jgi:hypothetical protein
MLNYDFSTPLTDEEVNSKLDAAAKEVIGRRMESAAIMFLEMHKPLSYLASQSIIVGMPFLGPLFGHQKLADLSKLLADSANVEKLIIRIEELAAARDDAEAEAAKKQE